MEQLVLELTRSRVQESPQPARGDASTPEGLAEGGTLERHLTTTVLEREEMGSQASSGRRDYPNQPLGQRGSPARVSRAPSAQLQPNPTRPEAKVDDD